jgi:hypothetical protein
VLGYLSGSRLVYGRFIYAMQSEGLLKNEYTKFQATHDKFCKDKAAHIQNFKGTPERAMQPFILKHSTCPVLLTFLSSESVSSTSHGQADILLMQVYNVFTVSSGMILVCE